eukprot:5964943-Prymnesium_polylepis.1
MPNRSSCAYESYNYAQHYGARPTGVAWRGACIWADGKRHGQGWRTRSVITHLALTRTQRRVVG